MIKKPIIAAVFVALAALVIVGCTSPSTNTQYLWLVDYQIDYLRINESANTAATVTFIASADSNIYHYPWCPYVSRIKATNRVSFHTAAAAEAQGYLPCAVCHPPH